MPVLATYFSVRRGRDPFFKFFMRTIFPKQVKEYEERFGIRILAAQAAAMRSLADLIAVVAGARS